MTREFCDEHQQWKIVEQDGKQFCGRCDIEADRAAVRALVEALPRCTTCGAPALHEFYEGEAETSGLACDKHRHARPGRIWFGENVHPQMAALRALLKRMEGW